MQRHWDLPCPDGTVMCCLCFDKFEQDQLYEDEDGKWDMCRECGEEDRMAVFVKNLARLSCG